MSEVKTPYTTSTAKPRAWELEERHGSGTFVVSRSGALLFRVELAIGMIYLWDKKASVEVPIRLSDIAPGPDS